MFRLLETIKVKNRQLQNVDYHNERLNRTKKELLGSSEYIDLNNAVLIPNNILEDIYKCRIIFSTNIDSVTFERYAPRKINSLKLVESNDIDYRYKYADRTKLDELLKSKGDCDEILIVKNGLITDTSFSNIILFDGDNWITPSYPLLKGTKRQHLLDDGSITEATITPADLSRFKYAKLINAMLEIEDSEPINIENIILFQSAF